MHNRIASIILLLIGNLLVLCQVHSQDKFADIGTGKYTTRTNLLIEPQPPVLPDINLPLTHNPGSVFKVVKPISTKEELYAELTKMRNRYEPFMQNLAPAPSETRVKIPLTEFYWRIETPADLTGFAATLRGEGNWEKVGIPHYGPPLGRAVTWYFKEIELGKDIFAKGNLFLCFKEVDYNASVFVNGSLCGTHEGFFAPFEFEISKIARTGKNTILIKVENDYATQNGKDDRGNSVIGDKIYAAGGPGWDEPNEGWHLCLPGMGISQDCYLESRSPLHINDIFVRPVMKDSIAETWLELNNFSHYPEDAKLKLSVYGQNFTETVIEDMEYIPSTNYIPGVGDLAKPNDWEQKKLKMGYGPNFLRIPLKMKSFRLWEPENPWLYQVQVKVFDSKGNLTDTRIQQFGMRSFSMDTINSPKGNMYLNGRMIRLRGANSTGFEQQNVEEKNWNQLRDDILLAKLCNMNYLRFTQQPVQAEVYDYCDRLGMLNQTGLPLFGVMRRNKFAEVVKQAEEMERLVRKHPSTITVTYINERFPNAEGHPQRALNEAGEFYRLFAALDQAVLLSNPDRVIKAGDRDYDPLNVMQKYFPKSCLPKDKEDEKSWNANRIAMSQTQRFHYMWYKGKEGYIEPFLACTISAPEWSPVLSSGASNWVADKGAVMAAAELKYGQGYFRICEVQLVDRITFNPTAFSFFEKITE